MFEGLGLVFKRELKHILGSKRTVIILFLIPLLFTLFYGSIYSEKTIKHLKLGVINKSPSQLSRTIVEGFRKSEKFDIGRHLNSEEEIAPLMATGDIDVVLIIPENFTQDIKKGKNSSVFIGANGSNMTISNTAMTGAMEIIGTISAGITINKFEAQGLHKEEAYQNVEPISFNLRPWYNPTNNYSNFLLLGYVMAIVQQVTLYFAASSIAEERKNGGLRELLDLSGSAFSTVLGKFLPYFLAGLMSWGLSFLLAIKVFSIPMAGSFKILGVLSLAFFFFIAALGVFFSTASKNSLNATQYSMLVALPSFLICGFTWPLDTMPKFFKVLAHILPLTYFAENVRRIALMGVGWEVILGDVLILCLGGAILLVLTIIIFYRRSYRKYLEEQV